MKKKLALIALLIPAFSFADVIVDLTMDINGEIIAKQIAIKDQEPAIIENDSFIFKLAAVPAQDEATITFEVFRKTEQEPILLCKPEIKAAWGKKGVLECSNEEGHYSIELTAIQN